MADRWAQTAAAKGIDLETFNAQGEARRNLKFWPVEFGHVATYTFDIYGPETYEPNRVMTCGISRVDPSLSLFQINENSPGGRRSREPNLNELVQFVAVLTANPVDPDILLVLKEQAVPRLQAFADQAARDKSNIQLTLSSILLASDKARAIRDLS
jgi:hypothetical protein